MKYNHITDATKVLLIAATTMITCIIVALGMNTMGIAKELNLNATDQISRLNNDLKDSDIKRMDGALVSGSEVVNFIKKYLGDYSDPYKSTMTVSVKTDRIDKSYDSEDDIKKLRDFTHSYYIKPTANFLASVEHNKNGIIMSVRFVQQ